MDSGLPLENDPPPLPVASPSPPFLIQPPPEDIDLDPDRPLSRASSTSTNNWNDIDELLPASRNSGFLSPDAASSFRRPSSRMSDSGAMEGDSVAAAAAASPFNFQTQFMSASPVKSVSYTLPPAHDSKERNLADRQLQRVSGSVVVTAINTPPSAPSIRSFRSPLLVRLPYCLRRSPFPHRKKHGHRCTRNSASGYSGAFAMAW